MYPGLRSRRQKLGAVAQAHHGRASDQRRFITVVDICLMLRPRSLMTVRDLRAAYHLLKYGGCTGMASFFDRWVMNHARTGYIALAKRSMRAGCDPGSCNGFCDKSLMAICCEGHVGRFSAAQFGHKVSNTGLAVLTDAVVVYASSTLQIDSEAFVDDFFNSVGVKAHGLCQGLKGGCPARLHCPLRKCRWIT
jgi:hypothetical protein